jgi:hypothetical protein
VSKIEAGYATEMCVKITHTHTHLHKNQSQNSRPVRTAAALPFMAAWDAFLNIGAFFNMSGSTMKRTLLPRMYTVSSCARFVSHPRQKRVFLKYGTPPLVHPLLSYVCLWKKLSAPCRRGRLLR